VDALIFPIFFSFKSSVFIITHPKSNAWNAPVYFNYLTRISWYRFTFINLHKVVILISKKCWCLHITIGDRGKGGLKQGLARLAWNLLCGPGWLQYPPASASQNARITTCTSTPDFHINILMGEINHMQDGLYLLHLKHSCIKSILHIMS
jgi:hypothetical protein